jgi:hypothetical protein
MWYISFIMAARTVYTRQGFLVGKLLDELRHRVRHGEWSAILRAVKMSQPTAWRMMNFARKVDKGKVKVK